MTCPSGRALEKRLCRGSGRIPSTARRINRRHADNADFAPARRDKLLAAARGMAPYLGDDPGERRIDVRGHALGIAAHIEIGAPPAATPRASPPAPCPAAAG